MSSNVDRQHVLSLFDTLHDKYQFQDGEYKELIEALGGKKKPLDVENAKFVRITYDCFVATLDSEDDYEPTVTVIGCQTILEVIDVPPDPSALGFVNIETAPNEFQTVPICFRPVTQSWKRDCTIINTTELKGLAYLMTTSRPYRAFGNDVEIRINDIEVLTTKISQTHSYKNSTVDIPP